MTIPVNNCSSPALRPPLIGVVLFWISCGAVLLGFAVHSALSYALLIAIIPVFYGSHEALHGTLLPGGTARRLNLSNSVALCIGFALQGMNFRLLRPAHLRHHVEGRYDTGYAPDRADEYKSSCFVCLYYVRLLGVCVYWQCVGIPLLLFPSKLFPLMKKREYADDYSHIPHWAAQLAALAFVFYAVAVGGFAKWLGFELVFCCLWSLLQNVSHYGLTGFNDVTQRVCARTYILPTFWRLITFGSAAHLAHHLFPNIPGCYLHRHEIQSRVEDVLDGTPQIEYGVLAFARDVLRQLRGPVPRNELSVDWIKPFE